MVSKYGWYLKLPFCWDETGHAPSLQLDMLFVPGELGGLDITGVGSDVDVE